jgi:DNA-binding MarR family transcriptional regulator
VNNPQGSREPEVGVDRIMADLLRAAHEVEDRLEAALATVQLSSAKLGVLTELAKAGDSLALSELASRIQCVRSNVTQLVDRLEAEGLVGRVHDASDRRSIRAVLTPEGKARQRAGRQQLERVQQQFGASLPSTDRAAFARVLAALG